MSFLIKESTQSKISVLTKQKQIKVEKCGPNRTEQLLDNLR